MSIPRRDGLNIVPFIDIMLVLLAIVLSVSTFIAQGHIKVNLPSSSSSQNPQEDKKVTIKVDSESKIYLDDVAISEDELEKKIATLDKNDLVVLKNDKDSKFSSFISIMDVLKKAGHEKFAIVTEKEQ
ncbi:TonB system transport protein ExbD [uncultured Campylobacter sp.]|uniref:TonB system transport protein ExbD n=1 Tax=uncultured Campylobacter sp. TaxID=218934 RepID=UPI002625C689|nr:TonB system transport protein ExbD [uncultured Campylobacter sp.]